MDSSLAERIDKLLNEIAAISREDIEEAVRQSDKLLPLLSWIAAQKRLTLVELQELTSGASSPAVLDGGSSAALGGLTADALRDKAKRLEVEGNLWTRPRSAPLRDEDMESLVGHAKLEIDGIRRRLERLRAAVVRASGDEAILACTRELNEISASLYRAREEDRLQWG